MVTNETETVQEQDDSSHAHPARVSVSDIDSQGTSKARRSTRERHPPQRFDPAKGMAQTNAKSVKFDYHDILEDLEHCHKTLQLMKSLPFDMRLI
jgi:hypothetical protein